MSSSYTKKVLAELTQGRRLVDVSLISQSGSAPRGSGAKMLIFEDGSQWGTVGGGRYEGETVKEGLAMLAKFKGKSANASPDAPGSPKSPKSSKASESASSQDYSGSLNAMENKGYTQAKKMYFSLARVEDMDMICGGNVLLLLELISPAQISDFEKAQELEKQKKAYSFVRHMKFKGGTSTPGFWEEEGLIKRFLIGENAAEKTTEMPENIFKESLKEKKLGQEAYLVKAEEEEEKNWLIEPYHPARQVHIFGGGHVSKALGHLASFLSFNYVIIEDREEFVSRERFPDGELVLAPSMKEEDNDKYFDSRFIGENDAIIIVTRGHAFDRDALASALKTKAGYIGMIGSTKKRETVYASLREDGIKSSQLDFVQCPIGLEIGAETPEEIAISIFAELICWVRGADY